MRILFRIRIPNTGGNAQKVTCVSSWRGGGGSCSPGMSSCSPGTCSRLLNTTRGNQSSLFCLKHVTKWLMNTTRQSVVFVLLKTRDKTAPEHHTRRSVVFVLLSNTWQNGSWTPRGDQSSLFCLKHVTKWLLNTTRGNKSSLCCLKHAKKWLLNTTRGNQSSLSCLKHVTKWLLNITRGNQSSLFCLKHVTKWLLNSTRRSVVFVLLQTRDTMASKVVVVVAWWSTVWDNSHARAKYFATNGSTV